MKPLVSAIGVPALSLAGNMVAAHEERLARVIQHLPLLLAVHAVPPAQVK